MDKAKAILNTADFVKGKLKKEGSGHDWFHIERVWNLARSISKEEDANGFVCEMAALLHDLIDDKITQDIQQSRSEMVQWLNDQEVNEFDIDHILHIIDHMSFSSGGKVSTIEGKVVQDADRLDAIGAIGIARCFQYSGFKEQLIYDPEIQVREKLTKESYRNEPSTAINHFYEKLLKLKELMNTDTGKKLAEGRHEFMERYLEQFSFEWEGEK